MNQLFDPAALELLIRRPVMRYHGGKFRLAPRIIKHFPGHERYVEPYCGGAGRAALREIEARRRTAA